MYTGIFSKTFSAPTVDDNFARVRKAGFSAVQFNFASAGLDALPMSMPDAAINAIALAKKRHDMTIEAVSATFNLIHPDRKVVAAGLASLEIMAACAPALGCRLFTLCTGTMDPDDQWRRHPDNRKPEAWKALLAGMERLLAIAEKHDILLGIEPEQANVVDSAEKARKLIDSLGSERVKVIFDPANLFEQASTEEQRRVVAEAIGLLAPDIAITHAKDRLADGSFASAGTGVLDYPFYLSRLAESGYRGCVVAHGLKAEEAGRVAAMLDGLIGAL